MEIRYISGMPSRKGRNLNIRFASRGISAISRGSLVAAVAQSGRSLCGHNMTTGPNIFHRDDSQIFEDGLQMVY